MSRVNIHIELVVQSERVRHRRLRNADVGTSPRTRDKQANEQVFVTKHEVAKDVANNQVSGDECQRARYRGGSKSLRLGRAASISNCEWRLQLFSERWRFIFSAFASGSL